MYLTHKGTKGIINNNALIFNFSFCSRGVCLDYVVAFRSIF